MHLFSKFGRHTLRAVVVALAFVATAVSSLFAQAMLVRYTRDRRPQDGAWALALGMFALASVALATGTATGWDNGTFRIFYLFGAVLDVPWLALGTVYLLASPRIARRTRQVLLVLSGFAAGVLVERADGAGARDGDPGRQGRLRCAAPGAGGGRERCRRGRDRRRRRLLGGPVREGSQCSRATPVSPARTS